MWKRLYWLTLGMLNNYCLLSTYDNYWPTFCSTFHVRFNGAGFISVQPKLAEF